MAKMSNEGQEVILLLIIVLILFKLMSTDPIYSTGGHIDSNKVNNIVEEFQYKHAREIRDIERLIRGIRGE